MLGFILFFDNFSMLHLDPLSFFMPIPHFALFCDDDSCWICLHLVQFDVDISLLDELSCDLTFLAINSDRL